MALSFSGVDYGDPTAVTLAHARHGVTGLVLDRRG
jgi:hypothetical protein